MPVKAKILQKEIHVLIVEDNSEQALNLQYLLEKKGYIASLTSNGKEALEFLRNHQPKIIICGLVLPGIDGYELCRIIKSDKRWKEIPVIILTVLSEPENIIKGLECGGDHFIVKPYDEEFLLSRINFILIHERIRQESGSKVGLRIYFAGKKHLINSTRIQILDLLFSTYEVALQDKKDLEISNNEFRDIVKSYPRLEEQYRAHEKMRQDLLDRISEFNTVADGLVQSISQAIEYRTPHLAGSCHKVANMACRISKELKLSENQTQGIRMASYVHNIGYLQVNEAILNKNGALTESELETVKSHPEIAFNMFNKTKFPWPLADILLQHHEKWDGSGYPLGLSGEKILIEARTLTVADVMNAMSTERPHRPAYDLDKALDHVSSNSGTLYDPNVVDACIQLINKNGYKMCS